MGRPSPFWALGYLWNIRHWFPPIILLRVAFSTQACCGRGNVLIVISPQAWLTFLQKLQFITVRLTEGVTLCHCRQSSIWSKVEVSVKQRGLEAMPGSVLEGNRGGGFCHEVWLRTKPWESLSLSLLSVSPLKTPFLTNKPHPTIGDSCHWTENHPHCDTLPHMDVEPHWPWSISIQLTLFAFFPIPIRYTACSPFLLNSSPSTLSSWALLYHPGLSSTHCRWTTRGGGHTLPRLPLNYKTSSM